MAARHGAQNALYAAVEISAMEMEEAHGVTVWR
jgi:hypothetical protein